VIFSDMRGENHSLLKGGYDRLQPEQIRYNKFRTIEKGTQKV
jgi:hypothetical protein